MLFLERGKKKCFETFKKHISSQGKGKILTFLYL